MSNVIELNVTGMTCDHCVHAVTNALQDVAGVTKAIVSLDDKSAKVEVEGEADVSAMIAAIEEEGYEAALK